MKSDRVKNASLWNDIVVFFVHFVSVRSFFMANLACFQLVLVSKYDCDLEQKRLCDYIVFILLESLKFNV